MLKILRNQKENNYTAVNIITIISLTTFLESILHDCFEYLLMRLQFEAKSESLENMFASLESTISNATFKTYNQLSKDLLGCPLKAFTTDPIWEGISNLFMLRNQVVHGNHLHYKMDYRKESGDRLTFMNGYKGVYDYLVKNQITTKKTAIDIFNNKVTEHFIQVTITFFLDVTRNMSSKYKLDAYSGFESLRQELLKYKHN